MTNTILIVNAATGETVQRERNAEEQAQYATAMAAAAVAEAESAAADAAKAAARESAMAKLAALGLNESEVESIVGSV
tara:strand:+ start:597 stop:830 length:234 start_codon:yes stop_codon:yes gene_type:complete